jgi:CDP-4-dehydro-6-deoxyglucose reductase
VYRVTQPTNDVSVLQLRLPAGVRAKFSAGQFVQIELEDGSRRNYSMANPPQESDSVQLHVRHVPGGRFSEGVLRKLVKGDRLRIELPFGEFTLRETSDNPAILVATGTGFAPIKSIVEDTIKRKLNRTLFLYWGARREEDLYLSSLARKWHDTVTSCSCRSCRSPAMTGKVDAVWCTAQCSMISLYSTVTKCTPAAIRQ